MQPGSIAQTPLDCMTKGMAKIKYCPLPVFTLITRDNLRFNFTGATNYMLQPFSITTQHLHALFLKPGKQFCIGN